MKNTYENDMLTIETIVFFKTIIESSCRNWYEDYLCVLGSGLEMDSAKINSVQILDSLSKH